MAKIVIAGVADCPNYAKIELLADQLALNLPEFQVHKITKSPGEWQNWLSELCKSNGWTHARSPIVWRELVDRGGKGLIIGGANEFQDYIACYYGIVSNMDSQLSLKIAADNMQHVKDEMELKAEKTLNVSITEATSETAYLLISRIASGDVFGHDVTLSLRLCGNNNISLRAVAMEVEDLASGTIRDIFVTSDPAESFVDCDVVILLDCIEETRADWLDRLKVVFTNYAVAIDTVASRQVKVVIGAESCSAHCAGTIVCQVAQHISPSNVLVLSACAAESRVRGAISSKLKVNSASIRDFVIWGDPSTKDRFSIDVTHCRVYDCAKRAIYGPGYSESAIELLRDEQWTKTQLPKIVNCRKSSAMGTAAAMASVLGDWWQGRYSHRIHSLAVSSQGWFGIPKGLFFSVPVRFVAPRTVQVVEDFRLTDAVIEKIQRIVRELASDVNLIYPAQEISDTTKS